MLQVLLSFSSCISVTGCFKIITSITKLFSCIPGSNRRGFRGNYRGAPRGGYRSQGQRPPRGGGPSSNGPVYRYESEFDFESANARFKKEAFEEEFKQLHVDDKSETSSRGVNESNEDDDTPQGEGSEVVVASNEAQAENDADSADDEFYDKSKSFFDSISCANTGGR